MEKTRQEIITTGAVGGVAFAMLASTNPDIAQEIKNVDPKRAIAAIDDALQELIKELPEGSKPKSAIGGKSDWKQWMPKTD